MSVKAGALEVEHVALELGGRPILKDASFTVAAGEFIGVLGPNGAGKTTLMRAMLGCWPLSKGKIRVNGAAVVHGNPSIGYMPQTRSGLAGRHVRGRDSSRWPPMVIAGAAAPNAAARADLSIACSIWSMAKTLATRAVIELSGGERQRLLLAQCLLRQPETAAPRRTPDQPRSASSRPVSSSSAARSARTRHHVLFSAHELNPLLNAIDRVLVSGNGRARLVPSMNHHEGRFIAVIWIADRRHARERPHFRDGRRRGSRQARPRARGRSGRRSHAHDHDHGTATIITTPERIPRCLNTSSCSTPSRWGLSRCWRAWWLLSCAARPDLRGHALSHVGFTGATGAVLVGVSPLWAWWVSRSRRVSAWARSGEKLTGRDVAIGVILTLSLGFGLLFLHFSTLTPVRRPRCCSAT